MNAPEQAWLNSEVEAIWATMKKVDDQRKFVGFAAAASGFLTVAGIVNPSLGYENFGSMGLSLIGLCAIGTTLWWLDLRGKSRHLTDQWTGLIERQRRMIDTE